MGAHSRPGPVRWWRRIPPAWRKRAYLLISLALFAACATGLITEEQRQAWDETAAQMVGAFFMLLAAGNVDEGGGDAGGQ